MADAYAINDTRYQFLLSSPINAVMESYSAELAEHDRKKRAIDEINNAIYGAMGEQKVVAELGKLSDDWILINDFRCKFNPPIYSRKENDHILSVQIDHILIGKSGVFLIETKNWNESSIKNPNLYSPIKQIARGNFALYRILNTEISNKKLHLKWHHWGAKKISIRNLLVLTNSKPVEQFEHITILTLEKLLKYVNYSQDCFSSDEVLKIANYLLAAQKR